MLHIIKKQTILLHLHQQKDVFELQHKMSERYWKDIVPMLQRVFDKISTEDETIYVDKFEIDLASINLNEIDKDEWLEQLEIILENQVREILGVPHIKSEAARIPRSINIFTQWLNYMETGQLPWNAASPDSNWRDNVLEAVAVDYESVGKLRMKILNYPFVLDRIISQHNEKFLENLATILSAYNHEGLSRVFDQLELIVKSVKTAKWKVAEINLSPAERRISQWKTILIGAAKKSTIQMDSPVAPFVRSMLGALGPEWKIPKKIESSILNLLPLIEKVKKEMMVKESRIEMELQKQEAEVKSILQKIITEEFDPQKLIATKEKMLSEEEGIYVNNAGIILVHPFLKLLLARLGIIHEGKFISEEQRCKAILILHYLATGKTEAEEFELTVAKILCELPIELPLVTSPELNDIEKGESDQMLLALIQQWEILKNTSLEGLRESFLQRPGKLIKRNGSLCLLVESSSIDMLLDYLPWNLSIIKLPWMKEMLRVEWR
ncbi:MAG: hypothetical protein C5B52_17445 [Bacteroidetes bacterium]|nr:MAG: hypothetical protein C5B52_17445 [Bacteroidota bacterium]